jgi:asparagine synthase (glutamine-hydrolysing)
MDNVPIEEKIQNGLTKAFARRAYKGLLPEATRNRITKTGWNAPAHKWFSNQGRHKLLDMISSRRFIERGIYNQQEVQKTVVNHFNIIDSGKNIENHMMVIWQIVALEIWLQEIERIPNKS